ncbi:alpha/beta hydrolase [Savagea sp. SN6]|uniref:Alpha/beta hydrolase n=1 Tax=Savagea serpentis TaxID=2785297 RepID=A0A8J7G2C2_9BACL|nr:alpha/beta hydrolase [Savagea serpentis]MBF4500860.1 alpha/beta hydrolase [Savagea serpentis]
MAIYDISFPSANKRDTVMANYYTPLQEPIGIIQVIHGFLEHHRRYSRMIQHFVDAGYVVIATDHIGHGLTAKNNNTFGNVGKGGYEAVIQDEITLYQLARKQFGKELPYFIFGHSWGSLIARCLTEKLHNMLEEDISGVVLCGTVVPFLKNDSMIEQFREKVENGEGGMCDDTLAAQVFKPLLARVEKVVNGNEWIAIDEGVIQDHVRDPLNITGSLTCETVYNFLALNECVNAPSFYEKFPEHVPVLQVAGDQDPVGLYGEGVYRVANGLRNAGVKDVTTIMFPSYRHEVHNEPKLRDVIIEHCLSFYCRDERSFEKW